MTFAIHHAQRSTKSTKSTNKKNPLLSQLSRGRRALFDFYNSQHVKNESDTIVVRELVGGENKIRGGYVNTLKIK